MKNQIIIGGMYRIIGQINKGGIGTIYLAEHIRLCKLVVLKKIKRNINNKNLVRQEADILKSLHHMYLPQVYDFLEYNSDIFTVIDYIEGNDLNQYVKQNIFVEEESLIKWMLQLCDALSYLHSRKPSILHNDIKPGNIIVNTNNDVCLIDFNISTNDADVVLGFTPSFSSPEQYFKVETVKNPQYSSYNIVIDVRSDLYSLGASVYAVVTHQNPDVCNVINGVQLKLSQQQTGYSKGFCAVVDKLMQPDPDDRYSSAEELKKALNSLKRQDIRFKKYVLAQVCSVFCTGIIILLGIWLVYSGIRINKIENFENIYRHICISYENQDYQNTIDESLNVLSSKSWKGIIDDDKLANLNYIVGKSYFNNKDYKTASKYIQNAIILSENLSDKITYEIDSAVIYAYMGDFTNAQKTLENAKSEGISNNQLKFVNAQIYFAQKNYDKVIDCLDLLDTNTIDSELYSRALELTGDAYFQTEKYDKASEFYENSYKAEKSIIRARKAGCAFVNCSNNLHTYSSKAKYLEKAITYYSSVVENEFYTVEDSINLAKTYRVLSGITNISSYCDKAISILNDSLKKFTGDYRIYQQLAIAYYNIHNYEEAKNNCRIAFQIYDSLTPDKRENSTDDDMSALYNIKKQYGI